ncbi:MAG: antibiotic biosynthesis monooxygenase [Muribaculaceae bacterium]|nr:antibiotic biosynthesis monooxygenase [Muribaculaceae bacterium]
MMRTIKILLAVATTLIFVSACGDSHSEGNNSMEKNMCEKLPMQADGIVRLSKIKVNPDYLDEYMKYAVEVGTTSLETEPGVLTMYAVADKDNPCNITILETYVSQEAYKSHIASEHFQKYKKGTLHMVDSLWLDDVKPLNPANIITNIIKK